jgi:predicted ATPase
MIYINGFHIPNQFNMDFYERTGTYPFSLFYFMEFNFIQFNRVTIFYGGNGSGKSTLLKLIAEKSSIEHKAVMNRTDDFINFRDLCSCSYYEDDEVSFKKPPEKSMMITSEDIMHNILEVRKDNSQIFDKREKTKDEYLKSKYSPNILTSLDDLGEFKKRNKCKSVSATRFVNEEAGIQSREFSNGENVLIYFDEELKPGNVYLLDEPETSLSPKFQFELAEKITEMARYYDCQFIIATHSPFILSIDEAKIYNLDTRPVEISKWQNLESIRYYFKFFMKMKNKFK